MIEIFRAFAQNVKPAEFLNKTAKFQLASDIYIFPEAKCPYCWAIIKSSKRIWHAKDKTLLGWWDIQGDKLEYTEGVDNWKNVNRINGGHYHKIMGHPHSDNGIVCFGDADHISQALFGGWDPGNSFDTIIDHWHEWMRDFWGHNCTYRTQLSYREDDDSDDSEYSDDDSELCTCPDCREARGEYD